MSEVMSGKETRNSRFQGAGHQPSAISHQLSSVERLLVRGPNWIGDAVMCTSALVALRELFPQVEITVLVKPAIAELLNGHPAIDRILVYEDRGQHAGLVGKWTLATTLRQQRFDLAVLFQNAFEAAFLTFLAGIPRRYGYATDGRGFLLSDPVAVPKRVGQGHQVQYYLDLLRPLGVIRSVHPPRLFLSEPEELAVRRKFAEAGLAVTDLIIGLNPGSTYGAAKRWLPERFAKVADRLVQALGHGQDGRQPRGGGVVRVVIVGARGEEALGRAIAESMETKPVQLSGRTSIRELMGIIKRCALFITNDTGPMHIAAALGVPVLAIFGPTDPTVTSPFGDGHMMVRHPVECSPCLLRECPIDHRCMTGITVEEVYQAAMKMMRTAPLAPSPLPLAGVTVFLDRDGTLNRDTGYVRAPEELELLPGVVGAVSRLNRAGARVVVITNQSGIARGLLTLAALEAVHARLRALLASGGAFLDAIYYCPHHPDDGCRCRKPQTGLVDRAVADLGLDLARAYVVGDQERDMELARRIGARSVLVMTGPPMPREDSLLERDEQLPDRLANGLGEAVDWILEDASTGQQVPLPVLRDPLSVSGERMTESG